MDKTFLDEIRNTSTNDLELILQDQKDLYSADEILIMQKEFESREDKNMALFDNVDDEDKTIEHSHVINREERIKALKAKGVKGYFEYTIISIQDENSGEVNTCYLNERINDMALDGWRLKTAFTNELGKNSSSISILGGTGGTNSTIEQNVLIFERYVVI